MSLYSPEIGYALRSLVVVMSLCSKIFGYVTVSSGHRLRHCVVW